MKTGPSYGGIGERGSGTHVTGIKDRIQLHLENNLIKSVDKSQFVNGLDVFSLDLSRNKGPMDIPDDIFENLASTLERLSLEALSLTFDQPLSMVSDLSKLTKLSVSHNNRRGYVPGAVEHVTVRLLEGPVTRSLRTLKMSHCGLRSLSDSSLAGLSSLESLDLSNNWFTKIPGAIKSLPGLKTLSLFHCYIKKLADFSFSGMTQLKSLHLSSNHLAEIEPFAFTGPENSLDHLRMARCRLTQVPTNALKLLQKLKYLDMSENRFTEAGPGAFKGSYCLTELLISARDMEFSPEAFTDQSKCVVSLTIKQMDLISIPREAVSKLTNLRRLSLDNNQIRELQSGAFSGIAASSIRLTGNPLTTIEDDAFRGLPSGLDINLSHTDISGIEFLLGYPEEAITSVNLDYAGLVCRCSMRDALNATLTARIYGSCRSGKRNIMLSSRELPQIVEDACAEESKRNTGDIVMPGFITRLSVSLSFVLCLIVL
ncbi:leucine-rich repeat-containing protein 15 [Elysia marginata]|uniref:Leucine-rich repeat-containing protein 15 n=1 Tax=Elysia marginata TaxID=1093978 RepID=A0AAV4GGM0_9GAST|nr:leucine-rich repeat-containing protein 15 [Elysia marginata]